MGERILTKGFYWIRVEDDNLWTIGRYTPDDIYKWFIIASEVPVKEDEVTEIGSEIYIPGMIEDNIYYGS